MSYVEDLVVKLSTIINWPRTITTVRCKPQKHITMISVELPEAYDNCRKSCHHHHPVLIPRHPKLKSSV